MLQTHQHSKENSEKNLEYLVSKKITVFRFLASTKETNYIILR